MAVFAYRGLVVSTGKQVTGFRDADNPKVLRSALKREGVMLTSAEIDKRGQSGKARSSGGGFSFFRRIGPGDVAVMTRQLATLVSAGIPLVESMSALTEQVEKPELQRVLTQVRDRLNEGQSLAKALEPHPKVFPNLYVNMVAAGEASGTLEAVLERLSDFMENQAKLRSKVTGALAYPILMVIIGTGLITIMMVAVVPKVTAIFISLDRALPWYTAVLIFVSNVVASNQMLGFVLCVATTAMARRALSTATMQSDGEAGSNALWIVGASLFGAVMLLSLFIVESIFGFIGGAVGGLVLGLVVARLQAYVRTPEGEIWKDGWLLKLPLFGPLFRMLAVARFARTLSTLLSSGVPLLKAMDIVKNVLDNAKLVQVIVTATGSIREGESIAAPLKRSGDFPPMVTHMIAVGEKSGQLEQMLENVAKAYDMQVETRVTAMTSLMEPLIIVILGGAVGFIAFSILMPLIQMNDFVQ